MKERLHQLLPIILIVFFAAFFIQRLFYNGYIFYGEEQGFLNYDYVNFRHDSIWDWSHNFGSIFSAGYFNTFTSGLFWKVAGLMGVSIYDAQKAFYFTVILATALFTYGSFLLTSKSRVLALLGTLLYLTTYHFYATLITSPKLLHFLIIPQSLFFWLMYRKTYNPIYVILNTICLYLTLSIGINPPQLIGAYVFITAYIFLFSFRDTPLHRILLFMFPYVLNFLFVLASYFIQIVYSGGFIPFNQFEPAWSATASRIYEVVRFFGGWWDYAGHQGLRYNHLSNYYHSHLGILVSYVPVLTLFILLIRKNNPLYKFRAAAIFVFSLFLVKGAEPPLNVFFTSLYDFSFFKIFREPWAKFMPNLVFSTYLAIMLLLATYSWKQKKTIVLLLSFVLLFQMGPLISGTILDHRNLDWKLTDLRIPAYWNDMKEYSKQHLNGARILVLPINRNFENPLIRTWDPYPYRGYPEEFLLYANIVNNRHSSPEENFIMNSFFDNFNSHLTGLTSIDYVLNQTDIVTESTKVINIASVEAVLDKDHKKVFGKLELYPIREEAKTAKVRTVSKLFETYKTCNFVAFETDVDYRNSAILKTTLGVNKIPLDNVNTTMERISPTNYKVVFSRKPEEMVGLLFVETYNKGWKLFKSPYARNAVVEESSHQPANCFANLWLIPKEKIPDNNTLYIQYVPETRFNAVKTGYHTVLFIFIGVILFQLKSRHIDEKP